MKKNILLATLVAIVAILLTTTLYLYKRIQAADAYIKALEADYPEYLDTTSGTDEFLRYYNNK